MTRATEVHVEEGIPDEGRTRGTRETRDGVSFGGAQKSALKIHKDEGSRKGKEPIQSSVNKKGRILPILTKDEKSAPRNSCLSSPSRLGERCE